MPPKIEINVTLSVDRTKVRLAVIESGKELTHAIIDPPELDTLIQALGGVRAQLADAFPTKLDPNPRLATTNYPNWWVFDPTPEGTTLALRHPGFGWLGFLLAPDRANEIAGWLVKS